MKILACGDVNARPGRKAIKKYLGEIISKYEIDFCVVDVDNVAHGLGVTPPNLKEIFDNGADVCTGGNHLYDKREIIPLLEKDHRLLRPLNYSKYMAGVGAVEVEKKCKKYLVIHLAGQTNMPQPADNPFIACDEFLSSHNYVLGKNIDAIVVDFHAETTSEKVALGHFLDGRVSFVFGTHTHIPTADATILEKGTAYITDLGMTGDYNSVIGVKKDASIKSFLKQGDTEKFSPTEGEATLCAAVVDVNEKTGLAETIEQIRIGGILNGTKLAD